MLIQQQIKILTMEITTVHSFLDYYKRIRQRTSRLLSVIPEEHINWAYKPGKFTIADQIRHIAAIERYMYAETIQGKPCIYTGCGKELADGYENVMKFFNEMHETSMSIFSKLSDADLQRKCRTPGNVDITIWKWLRAMTEHEIHHRGQLYIYLNLIGVETPPMFELSSEDIILNSRKG